MAVMLRAVGLTKVYRAGGVAGGAGDNGVRDEVVLFRGLDFSVAAGVMVAIVGESGTGKSSLLHLLAALDRPTSGEVWLADTNLSQPTPRQFRPLRAPDEGRPYRKSKRPQIRIRRQQRRHPRIAKRTNLLRKSS